MSIIPIAWSRIAQYVQSTLLERDTGPNNTTIARPYIQIVGNGWKEGGELTGGGRQIRTGCDSRRLQNKGDESYAGRIIFWIVQPVLPFRMSNYQTSRTRQSHPD